MPVGRIADRTQTVLGRTPLSVAASSRIVAIVAVVLLVTCLALANTRHAHGTEQTRARRTARIMRRCHVAAHVQSRASSRLRPTSRQLSSLSLSPSLMYGLYVPCRCAMQVLSVSPPISITTTTHTNINSIVSSTAPPTTYRQRRHARLIRQRHEAIRRQRFLHTHSFVTITAPFAAVSLPHLQRVFSCHQLQHWQQRFQCAGQTLFGRQ